MSSASTLHSAVPDYENLAGAVDNSRAELAKPELPIEAMWKRVNHRLHRPMLLKVGQARPDSSHRTEPAQNEFTTL